MTLGTKDTPKTQEESILKAGSLGCPQGRTAVDFCVLHLPAKQTVPTQD